MVYFFSSIVNVKHVYVRRTDRPLQIFKVGGIFIKKTDKDAPLQSLASIFFRLSGRRLQALIFYYKKDFKQ